jgi:hypothetical protein
MTDLIIPVNKKAVPKALLLAATITTFLVLAITDPTGFPSYVVFYDWAFLIIAGYYTLYYLASYLKTLFDPSAKLVLSDAGLDDNTGILSCGFIPWSEVKGTQLVKVFNSEMLLVAVQDPGKIVARQNAWKRMHLRRMVRRLGTPVAISSIKIKTDLREVEKWIQARIGSATPGH